MNHTAASDGMDHFSNQSKSAALPGAATPRLADWRANAADGLVFIALGSNLGDRAANIRGALHELERAGVARLIQCSRLVETDAVGGPADQPRYLNGVARLATSLDPHELLIALLRVEQLFGRVRDERNAPRTLDLDLLLYGSLRLTSTRLTLPHPRMWDRDFVMTPLAEVCDAAWLETVRTAAPAREQKEPVDVR
ncbi:MAG: 2-amino-4-hydroxy-6-hydroxymethyldihydropteridine diphosphokinase [Phycisphaerales bacterium]|nr:2-amino-4-hydroxy-6-hydroxymethyldihydropteridine diphosphokinase [Phycisphaerales bacterium]